MSLYSRYRSTSDDRWFKTLIPEDTSAPWLSRLKRKLVIGRRDPALPGFPDSKLQAQFVGSSGYQALREGFQFYQVVKQRCASLGFPISPTTRILDFGVGWGRIVRFFLKEVPPENIVGVDVDPDVVKICRETIREGQYEVVSPGPPTHLKPGSVDLIYAYSVFSHLAEEVHMKWVQEFARLLRVGGLVFATTQKRSFIEYCNDLTEDKLVDDWHRSLVKSFRPRDVTLARYDRGEFIYEPTGGGGVRDASFYGEAAVSERYVEKYWTPYLKKLVFDSESLPQALIIAQKSR